MAAPVTAMPARSTLVPRTTMVLDDGDDYTVLWHNETPNGFTMAMVEDALYFVNHDGSLLAVGARDGALLWETAVPADAMALGG